LALSRGAKVVSMPRLGCMPDIEQRRLSFGDAQHGRVPGGQEPFGLMRRQMVTIWLRQMEEAFKEVLEWLP
jgi:hypothetical protein